jgi:zinc-ribbon domain
MYCPKCGTENAETNKFCRACRGNLKVVSQAMKQRLPVLLARKFDQMIDSRGERFRPDSEAINGRREAQRRVDIE